MRVNFQFTFGEPIPNCMLDPNSNPVFFFFQPYCHLKLMYSGCMLFPWIIFQSPLDWQTSVSIATKFPQDRSIFIQDFPSEILIIMCTVQMFILLISFS